MGRKRPKKTAQGAQRLNEEAIVHRDINLVNRIQKEILLALCML